MIKTYILKLFILILISAIFSSCDDPLEIEPAQEIRDDLALNSPQNVRAVLIGAYDELGVSDVFGGEILMHSELLGGDDEILWAGTFNAPREIFNKDMQTVNGEAAEVWLESYETINITNNVLNALDVFTDEDEKNTVEGEARFIRALSYFELARFYGLPYEAGITNSQLAVPLVLSPTIVLSEENLVSRNTVEEVYTQVLSDLNFAKNNLPSSNGFFATSGAASALLARVHLQMGNFAAARDEANAVITSENYELEGSFANAFNQDANPDEYIFAMQVSSQDGINQMNTFFATPQFGARDGDVVILQGHLDLYPDGDDRGAFFYEDGDMFTSKYTNQFGNIPVLRLAEMYLIRAEANLEEGTTLGATPLEDINTIRERANAPLLNEVTLEDVYFERRLELALEGHKIHDIKRLKQNVGDLEYNANALVFPIPQRERNANNNLAQNPGYGDN
ncbi:MAG: RagB/SusD family nutrient uptake outer membrane protein [Bacteroidota bacterium]